MIHRMGNDNGGPNGVDALWWVLGGTAATVALYHLFGKSSPVDLNPFVQAEEPTFSDLNSVATRFGQIRDLWSMGYINSAEAATQLETLVVAILKLQSEGKASAASTQELVGRIEQLIKDITEYQAAA